MGRKCLIAIASIVIAVLVVAAVAVTLYFTVFKDDDDDDKSNNGTVTKMMVQGHWADWDSWSQCSVTCDGGTQSRQRACADPPPENGGADCVGKSQEMRACAEWDCPNCSRTCPSSGVLVNCSLCECIGDSTSGKVTITGTNLPLADVSVYVIGHEWEPLVSTNALGAFTLDDLCVEDLELKFMKTGYQSELYSVISGVDALVQMTKLVKPVFTVHPQSMTLFAGDMIFIRCDATGVPTPTMYEWFKDGDIKEHTPEDGMTNVLKIDNAQTTHQGEYKCRATSAAGKKFSKIAKVIVSDSGDDTCSRMPLTKLVSLPPTCILPSSGETTVNVGTCSSDICTTRTPNQPGDIARQCCGPATTEVLQLECDGFEYSVSTVKTCGCTVCQDDGLITIEGILVDGTDQKLPVRLRLEVNSQSIRTSLGEFTWTGTPSGDTVTVTFEPRTNDQYLATAAVVHITEGVTTYQLPLTLTPRPDPVTIDGAVGATLEVSGSPGMELTIQPDSAVDESGNPITGELDVFVSFSDPRVEGGLSTAPGEFTFEDEEGETRELQTFGVFGLQAMTKSNMPAFISGKVDFDIDSSSLNIPEKSDGQPDAVLWTLDPVTGKWTESGPLETGDGSTRKRRQASQSGASGSSEFPPNIPYINIDKPLLRGRQCYVSVFVYGDQNMTEGFPGQNIKIYTKDVTGTTYLGQSSGSTDQNGKVCLPLACGLTHELVVYSGYGPIASETHQLPDDFVFSNTHSRTRVAFTSPDIDDITNGDGPVHKYTLNTCPSSTQDDFHFQFYLKSVPKPGRLDAVELKPNKTLSWYSNATTACMLGFQILTDDPSGVQLVGQSFQQNADGPLYGTYTTGILDLNSRFQGDAQGNYIGCVQVKCPGKVYDEGTQTTTEDVHTYVKLNLATANNSQCFLDYTNQNYYSNYDYGKSDYEDEEDVINAVSFVELTNSSLGLDVQDLSYDYMTPEEAEATGARTQIRNNGLYQSSSVRLALNQCLSNQYHGIVAAFDCADGKYDRFRGYREGRQR